MKLEDQMNALLNLLTAGQEEDLEDLSRALRKLFAPALSRPQTPEQRIRALLLELGAPDRLTGHAYTVEALLLILEDRAYIHSITFGLYPQVAAKFDTTAARVERAIRHLIEVLWTRGDLEVLSRYFGNTVSAEKGKPTNGEFLARLANILKEELAMAA